MGFSSRVFGTFLAVPSRLPGAAGALGSGCRVMALFPGHVCDGAVPRQTARAAGSARAR